MEIIIAHVHDFTTLFAFYGHEQSRVISGETLLIMLILVIISENFMFILIS